MKDLRDKVAVVTGAGSGIGLALAHRFADEGMKLVLADVDEEALVAAASELRSRGREATFVPTDVSKSDAVEALARATLEAYGRVHVVCNNAGVAKHSGEALWEMSEADWNWLMGPNLWGIVHGIRAFVPILLAQNEEAHIVNTCSLAGLVVGGGAYGVTKHAAVSLSENLFADLQRRDPKIGVSCLCPGSVATNIVENARRRLANLPGAQEETAEQLAYRQAIADRTRQGAPPSEVAELVLQGIRERQFYLWMEDSPWYVSAEERIRLRMENILQRKNPIARLLRDSPPTNPGTRP